MPTPSKPACRRRVVRLANAEHDVFRSNEAEVTREMNAFMDQLGK
jgi:hypothetical protein